MADRRAPVITNGHSDVNISRVANISLPLPLKPYHFLCFFFYLELPVCRLQKLLRLVCRTTRRQDELVNHDLMFEFIHFRRSPCPTRGDWLWNTFDPFPLCLHSSCIPFLRLSRPPLQPVQQTQIFTVGAVVEGDTAWLTEGRSQSNESIAGGICMLQAEGLGWAWL